MSIDINRLYCNHWLNNDKLRNICQRPKFESFACPEHRVVTCFHIKDTIHYNALINDDYTNYEIYIKATNQKEHDIDTFLTLLRNFNINKMKKIKVKYNPLKDKFFIKDGVHRLAILVFKNIINDQVPIQFLDIE